VIAADDANRAAFAGVLRELGHIPWPLRYSKEYHTTEKWGVRRRMCTLHPRRERGTIEKLADGVLANFRRPCVLELLTGAVSDTVAVNSWTTEGEAWVWLNLSATPMVLKGSPVGTCFFYRHPGQPVQSRHVFVDGPNEPTIIRILSEWESVIVPVSAYEVICDWPAVSALPIFSPAWIPERQRWGRAMRGCQLRP
jgi:hypothetical protein